MSTSVSKLLFLVFFFSRTFVEAGRTKELLQAKSIIHVAKQRGIGLNVINIHAPRSTFRRQQQEQQLADGPLAGILRYSQSLDQRYAGSKAASTAITLGQTVGEYYTTAKLGSGAGQEVILIIDTGSEMTWVQCAPCKACARSVTPVYDPSRSASKTAVPCDSSVCSNSSQGTYAFCEGKSCSFATFYADGSFSYGKLATDFFTMEAVAPGQAVNVNRFLFGCASVDFETVPTGASGLLGLDFGRLGLPMQLGEAYRWKFSHCFPDRVWHLNSTGVVYFGETVGLPQLAYTPLTILRSSSSSSGNSRRQTPFYFIGLSGISVDERPVQVAETSFQRTIVDSGTSFTVLLQPVYRELRRLLIESIRSRRSGLKLRQDGYSFAGLDTCFDAQADFNWDQVPKLALHFSADGSSKVELPASNVLLPVSIKANRLVLCFAFQDAGTSGMNIVGNYQQQNLWVEYDIQNSRVGFAQAHCALD